MTLSKFHWEPSDVKLAACVTCKHKSPFGPTCAAFPEGIPNEILDAENDHRESFPGDHGIRYEPMDVEIK